MVRWRAQIAAASVVLGGFGAACEAQVLINEVYLNPPGIQDAEFEFIELYGRPGTSLDGYLLAYITQDHAGGAVVNEAFELDGFALGPNGFFVVFATKGLRVNRWAQRDVSGFLPGPSSALSESRLTHAWLNGATYSATQAAQVYFAGDDPLQDAPRGFTSAGLLGSAHVGSVLLIRGRPGAGSYDDAMGVRFHAPDYAWLKGAELNADQLLDGAGAPRLDVRVTHDGLGHSVANAPIAPFQVVDEVSWTDGAPPAAPLNAALVVRTEFLDAPGAIVRLGAPGGRAVAGHRTESVDLNEDGSADCYRVTPTTIAGESFVFAQAVIDTNGTSDPADDNDRLDGSQPMQAPTAPGAMPVFSPGLDPEPDPIGPFGLSRCAGDGASGPFFFDHVPAAGLPLTPAAFNDDPAHTAVRQFRFVGVGFGATTTGFDGFSIPAGDLNFDGNVDAGDVQIASAFFPAGAAADDLVPFGSAGAAARTGDGVQTYAYQGLRYQQLLMLTGLVDDGVSVTQADLDVLASIAGSPVLCPGDFDGNGGQPNPDDLQAFAAFAADQDARAAALSVPTTAVDFNDWRVALDAIAAGCP